jgi:integrase
MKQPPARTIRQHRNEKPKQLFTPAEIQALVKAAKPQLKAMILLGINCGFGNSDCGTLPIEALDLANGWHNYWRPKTHFQRRCPLWPETVKALSPVVAGRDSGLVFITKYGNPWWTDDKRDPIAYEFRKLANAVGVYRKGVTKFYSLRHTFKTVADTTKINSHVVHSIMGWADDANDMGAVYREQIYDQQLLEVTNHVRKWYRGKLSIA